MFVEKIFSILNHQQNKYLLKKNPSSLNEDGYNTGLLFYPRNYFKIVTFMKSKKLCLMLVIYQNTEKLDTSKSVNSTCRYD